MCKVVILYTMCIAYTILKKKKYQNVIEIPGHQ